MSKCFIQLARLGDLINSLPLFHAEAIGAGQPTRVMCCKQYAHLFGGTSYVQCLPFDGGDNELRRAWQEVGQNGHQPVSLQVIGETVDVKDLTYGPAGYEYATSDSFQKEPYWLVHAQSLWAKQPRPIFDGRSKTREIALAGQHPFRHKQKTILVAASGRSSPFAYKSILMELLRGRFPGGGYQAHGPFHQNYEVVDLDEFKAERFYDFLGILEQAYCLVSIDSAFLHLAHAVEGLPVCALVNDKPSLWHGSAWRSNHISYIRYSDFPTRGVDLLDAIEAIGKQCSYFPIAKGAPRKLVHVWSEYEECDSVASGSWIENTNEKWTACPVPVGAFGRDSRHHSLVKDQERYPFLKDVIRCGLYRAQADDIVVVTRSNTCFERGITEKLLSASPCFSHRYIRDNGNDTWHPSVDLFSATKKWWQEHYNEIPEFFLATDMFWSRALRDVFIRGGASDVSGICYRAPAVSRSNSPLRYSYQEAHLKSYESKHGAVALWTPACEQLPSAIINRHALPPYSYNPAIWQREDRMLCVMRYHDQRDYSTALCIAEIDEKGVVFGHKMVQLPHNGGSEEDARFFVHKNALWMSYVDSTYPTIPAKSVVKYGRLTEDTVWSMPQIYQPQFPGNDMSSVEKNWVMWESDGNLFCIYSTSPKTVILKLTADRAELVAEYEGPRWSYGAIRGGTTPVPYKGALLRFFHSALDSDLPPYRRRYFVGAMTMEPQFPFKPLQVSRKPVLAGSESDTLTAMERSSCPHFKQKVVFPLGCVEVGGGEWLLSAGINDSHAALFKVNERNLNL